MSAPTYLIEAVVYLSAAVIAVPLFKRLGLGAVLGYLLAGVLIGPFALKLIANPARVLHFAEFGVVLLLFLVGLELQPAEAWRLRRSLFGLGGLQVLGSILAISALAYFFGLPWQVALAVGIGACMSSTAIGLASLEERKLLQTPGGRASFAVLLFQDLAVIPLFMVLALMAPTVGKGLHWSQALQALLVIAGIIIASRTVVRPLMRVVAQTGLREIFIAFSLLLVIVVSLAVQAVGLSMALGTFLAGMLLADSEYRYELQLNIEPVKGLLLGLFFIAVGMSVDVSLIARAPLMIIGFALGLVAVKAAVLYGLARIFKLRASDAGLFAVGLSQVGEFAFVIFGVALGQDTLDRETYNILNAIVAVSMLCTPLLFAIYDRIQPCKQTAPDDEIIDEQHPVVIAGFGRFGQVVLRVLQARGIKAVLIDRDPIQIETMRRFGWHCYYGDASRIELLEQAGIAQARLFVIAIDDAAASITIARKVRARWPDLPIVARARSRVEVYEFLDLGLQPIRETFHSALEAARQALIVLGTEPHSALRAVRHFDRHDQDMIEKTLAVRNDQQALMSIVEQGRRDLEAVMAAELSLAAEEAAAKQGEKKVQTQSA